VDVGVCDEKLLEVGESEAAGVQRLLCDAMTV
jgi:hypothetical protein